MSHDSARASGTRRSTQPGSPGTGAIEALAAATFAFELVRLMGTSIAMIDPTYGRLARDFEEAIRAHLDARAGRVDVSRRRAASTAGTSRTAIPLPKRVRGRWSVPGSNR
jgi:hypothetical protein